MARAASSIVIVTLTVLFSQATSDKNSTQCYDELGCFPMGEPWSSLLRPFPRPQTLTEINTHIYCYTRDDPETRYTMTLWPNISVNGLPFSANRTTAFITHGFYSSSNESWVSDMKNAYLEAVDANVCEVDWCKGADTLNYLQVASNTRIVGAELARFIRFLQSEYGLNATNLHLIGHSLGAHVSAYAAKNVTGVNRITGLDVAQPGFEGFNITTRLDKTDADFVDAIHTNGAPFFPAKGLGWVNPIGHVDFFMNDGQNQPGCRLVSILKSGLQLLSGLSDLASSAATALVDWSSCSHGRSFHYFTSALSQNCSIWGLSSTMKSIKIISSTKTITKVSECTASTCVPLGLYTPEFPGRGVFTATTPNKSPFCSTEANNNAIVERILSVADADGLSDSLVDIIKGYLRD